MIEPNTTVSNARDNAHSSQHYRVDYWYPSVNRELFKSVIKKFGIEHQIAIFTEEAAEVLVAISRHRRQRGTTDDVVEELVDLSIMIGQMRIIYDPDDIKFHDIYKYKIDRLNRLLKE